ncbi:hypothetical protein LT493_36240 [Streptomyces tricolor]|nr:hypothetical protein [Streptomyces tricolor]
MRRSCPRAWRSTGPGSCTSPIRRAAGYCCWARTGRSGQWRDRRTEAAAPRRSTGAPRARWRSTAGGVVYVADLNGHRVWRLADGAARVVAGPRPGSR